MKDGVGVRKMMWMQNGAFDSHLLVRLKEEGRRGRQQEVGTLRDIKQAREEAEELLEASARIGTSSSSASLVNAAQSASNAIANLSPRQQW
uniref:Uncharacterized protein n=1 Tax=Parascaris equorum TaxID=6256 RepID=A0A914S7P0_PAREQ